MTNFIPLFPLNIVVFPGEKLNLHIFEPKYIQMVNECIEQKKMFGIVSVINDKLSELGTSIEINTVENILESGEMDVKTVGKQIFRTLELIQDIPDKLYKGAIVSYPDNNMQGIKSKMYKIMMELKYFHQLLDIEKNYHQDIDTLLTYDIAHHVGMTLEQEYDFLELLREDQRQEYIQRHLKKMIPMVQELQRFKERIKQNGHFRKLSIDDFEL